jgi:uncharacterized SAM-binding protein YcdF (DUF218 family)
MALALPFLIGVVVAMPFGGRVRRLAQVRLRWIWLAYGALAIQIVAFPGRSLPWSTPDGVAVGLWILSDLLLIAVVARNIRIPGVALVAAGLCSNLIAVLANGGHMPALPRALAAAGLHYTQSMNSKAMAHPALPWLVDRWAAPHWFPLANIYSVGDVLIAIGGFVLALAVTGARMPGRKPRPAVS